MAGKMIADLEACMKFKHIFRGIVTQNLRIVSVYKLK